jgi:hypothetical protein
MCTFALTCDPHQTVTITASQEIIKPSGLKSMKPREKINISSFKLIFSSILSHQLKADPYILTFALKLSE